MKEYISKEYIYGVLASLMNNSCGAERYAYDAIKNAIESAPTEDIAPVIHSMWRFNRDGSGTCKHCHRHTLNAWDYDNWLRYCPDCGARMDKER